MGQSRLVSWEGPREASRAVRTQSCATAPRGLRPPSRPALGYRGHSLPVTDSKSMLSEHAFAGQHRGCIFTETAKRVIFYSRCAPRGP